MGNGKPRELHIEKALEVMKFDAATPAKVSLCICRARRVHKMLLAACSYFAAERWEFRATVQAESQRERFERFRYSRWHWPHSLARGAAGRTNAANAGSSPRHSEIFLCSRSEAPL